MADIIVDVSLPAAINVDVTSPTQALATNVSVPGPQGPAGPRGFTSLINGISGESISLSGQDGIIISSDQSVNTIYVSGNSGYFQSAVNSLTTNLQSTGSNLYTLLTNFSGNLDATYATDLQLYNTGSTLDNKINSLSGNLTSDYVTKINGQFTNRPTVNGTGVLLSGEAAGLPTTIVYTTGDQIISGNKNFTNILLSGNPILTGVNLTPYATIINLAVTGSTLDQKINSLSGYVNIQDLSISNNLASTGSSLQVSINSVSSNLISTGTNLDNKINSLSGTLTGNYLTTSSASNTYATITNLASTGSTLDSKINALSGNNYLTTSAASTTYATITNLASTGSTLDSKINSLSGWSASAINLSSTGSVLDLKINNLSGYVNTQDNTISTNLYNTGNTLNNRINSLSGYTDSQDTTISNNLRTTGSTLDTKINSLSGVTVLTYGNQTILGNKTFNDNTYINNLFVTGTQTIVSTNNFSVQSPYILLNLTGGAVDGGIFFVTGAGLTGLNDSGPIIGFDHSKSFKFGISTRNSDLSTLPDIASVQELRTYSGVALNTFSTITNLASTGSNLDNKINSLSGWSASAVNLALTGSTLDSKINSLSGWSSSATNLASTGSTLDSKINSLSGNLTSTYSTITNLGLTGSTLDGKINSLSGWSASASNLASSGSTLDNKINSLSGNLTSTYSTISNLALTGSTLDNKVNSLSGNLTSNYATIINLFSTGSTLDNKVNSLSGWSASAVNLASTGSTLDGKINNLSGWSASAANLASTGSNLDTKINNLSGYVTGITGTFGASVNSLNANSVFITGNQLINGTKTFNSGVVINVQPTGTNPALYITGTWNDASQVYNGISLNITDTASNSTSSLMDLQVGGSSQLKISKFGRITSSRSDNGAATISVLGGTCGIASNAASLLYLVTNTSHIQNLVSSNWGFIQAGNLGSNGGYCFSTGPANTPDLILARDAANILAQRNGTNAQQFRVYNATGTNSGEFGLFGWQNNQLIIGSQVTNSGISRDVLITGNNVLLSGSNFKIDNNGTITTSVNANSTYFADAPNGSIAFRNQGVDSFGLGANGTVVPNTSYFGWSSLTPIRPGNSNDVRLYRDGVGILALRNAVSLTNPHQFRIYNSSGTNSGEFGLVGWDGSNNLIIGSQATNSGILRNVVVTGNNVLLSGNNINVTTDGNLVLGGSAAGTNAIISAGGSNYLRLYGSAFGNQPLRVLAAGGLGFGDNPLAILISPSLDVLDLRFGTTSRPQQFRIFNATGTNSGEFGLVGWINSGFIIGPQQTTSGILRDLTLTGNNININASGVVNILDNTNIVGNLTVSGNTTITGHLSAASKSFLIDHPTIIGKKLQYGSLESPYHGIRLTDKNKISADSVQVNLPDYISALVNEDKVNVQLTNINHDKVLFVKEVNINDNNFIVGINRGWFDKNEYEFYWSFTAERKDIPKLTVEF